MNHAGKFSFIMDLFKKGGGEKESERLGVPLLGKIPLSEDIMSSTDAGTPLAAADPVSSLGQIYLDIAEKLLLSIQ